MMGLWQRLFGRAEPAETRSAGTGFTAEIISARASYLGGRGGLGDLTATVATCVDLWANALALADVEGALMLTRRTMGMAGRALALRGEAVFLIDGDRLLPAAGWDLSTRGGEPWAYRLSLSEAGGGSTQTALAGEVLHLRIGVDPSAPWQGSPPLRRAALSAGLLHTLESALGEIYADAPIGAAVIPTPESTRNDELERSFRGARGKVVLRESMNVNASGGPGPSTDWRPASLSPMLRDTMAVESWSAARDAVAAAFGVLPCLLAPSAAGPSIREGQRHLAAWVLAPIAETIAEEASLKLGAGVRIDVLTPLQAFDQGGSARAVATLIGAMAQAKEAGLSPQEIAAAFAAMDWTAASGR